MKRSTEDPSQTNDYPLKEHKRCHIGSLLKLQ